MTKESLMEFLAGVGDETHRRYEIQLTAFAANNYTEQTEQELVRLLDADQPDAIAYNAFYCLNIMYRRQKDYPKLDELVNRYRKQFRKHVTFDHLLALYYLDSDSLYDYESVLETTYKDARFFADNAGFVHLFADTFVTIYEKRGIKDVDKYLDDWYDEALEEVNHAIKLDPAYAKYYCTKARILLIDRQFDQAESNINKAIGLEDSRRSDYFLRISGYQYYKMLIYTERRLCETSRSLPGGMQPEPGQAPAALREGAQEEGTLSAYAGSEPFVFVSYSHKDKEPVCAVLEQLQRSGVRFWYDEGLLAGAEYVEQIGQRIRDCTSFVLFISGHSVKSEFVRKEYHAAMEYYGKAPICWFLEETDLSPGMILQLGKLTHIRPHEIGREEAMDKLLTALPASTRKGSERP